MSIKTKIFAVALTALTLTGSVVATTSQAQAKPPEDLPQGVTIFQGGTCRDLDGVLRVNGGRVLTATGVAGSFPEAQQLSCRTAEAVQFEGKTFRRDIGWREASRQLAYSARGSSS